jgi:hypothetical protein
MLLLLLIIMGLGLAVRAVSKRYAGEVSVPGIYVKVRPERGGLVEARSGPVPARHAGNPKISMEVTLADVASLVRLIEDVARTPIKLPCPVAQRVSLRVRDAPLEQALEALAAVANLTLSWRDGAYTLSSCVP